METQHQPCASACHANTSFNNVPGHLFCIGTPIIAPAYGAQVLRVLEHGTNVYRLERPDPRLAPVTMTKADVERFFEVDDVQAFDSGREKFERDPVDPDVDEDGIPLYSDVNDDLEP